MRKLLLLLIILYTGGAWAAASAVLPSATLAGLAGPLSAVPLHAQVIQNLARQVAALEAEHPRQTGLFALDHPVNLGLAQGLWEPLNNGDWVWRMRVSSPQAVSMVLHFAQVSLPGATTLRILGADGSVKRGPYTGKDLINNQLWTPFVRGDQAVIEVVAAAADKARVRLQLASIGHAWRAFGSTGFTTKAGTACYTDVVCPEGNAFRNQIRAVVMIQFNIPGGYASCSATLLNNTSQDRRPYLLTANHCINTSSEASSLVAYWNFQKPQCGGPDGSGSQSQTSAGSTLRAHDQATDFSLVELAAPPQASFNAYYAGWSRSLDPPAYATCIHHPKATEKRISESSSPPQLAALQCVGPPDACEGGPGGVLGGLLGGGGSTGAANSAWQVQWSGQPTDSGSSGSGLFTPQGLLIGQLSQGNSSCDTPDGFDQFGNFNQSWNGDGTTSTSLKGWLDPTGSNVTSLDGINAASGGGSGGGAAGSGGAAGTGGSGGGAAGNGGAAGTGGAGAAGGQGGSQSAPALSHSGSGGCTVAVAGDSGLEYLVLLLAGGLLWRRRAGADLNA